MIYFGLVWEISMKGEAEYHVSHETEQERQKGA